jgi:hypothetical protein
MTPNYCVLDDVLERMEPKARFFKQNAIPVGLCKTDKEHWYSIAQLLLHDGTWEALSIYQIRLKEENYRSVNDLLAEVCDRLDIPYENLLGQNVTANITQTGGGKIITVNSLGWLV